LLLRALEVYEVEGIDFAEAYLVASAEASGVETIASFDRTIDRLTTVRRILATARVPPIARGRD
jgi:predicted nucleic acid-binding protein